MSEHPNLATALAAFQADLPKLGKDSTANAGTYTYDYADLAAVSHAVLPLLGRQGLSFSSKPTLLDGKFVLAYTLRHSSGESDGGFYPLPTTGTPQQVGSALTYARRYTLMAVTGVFPGGEDDDGKSAGEIREVWQEPAPVPTEAQAAKFDALMKLINGAGDDAAILEHGKAVAEAKAKGSITPIQYDQLARRAAARLAEFKEVKPGEAG